MLGLPPFRNGAGASPNHLHKFHIPWFHSGHDYSFSPEIPALGHTRLATSGRLGLGWHSDEASSH